MKKIFIDCGTHFGQGIKSFRKQYKMNDLWKIFTWEANPSTHKKFLESELYKSINVTSFNSAVSTYNGTISLNVETVKNKNEGVFENTGQGSSIVSADEWTMSTKHKGSFLETVEVPCIDISEWILQNCSSENFVVMKLDVEGAEYSILEKILKDGSASLIDDIYIEWHSRFFSNPEQYLEKEKEIIDQLQKIGVKVNSWK
jgi:FkbM family methyltransferase